MNERTPNTIWLTCQWLPNIKQWTVKDHSCREAANAYRTWQTWSQPNYPIFVHEVEVPDGLIALDQPLSEQVKEVAP